MLFGGQGGIWEALAEEGNEEWNGKVEACKLYLVATFQRSPILHFCQRGHSGPLSLPHPIFTWGNIHSNPSPNKPLFTIHLNIHPGSNKMPVAIGHLTRWTMEERPPIEHCDVLLSSVHDAIGPLLGNATAQRRIIIKNGLAQMKSNFHLQLWASTTGIPSAISLSVPVACDSTIPPMSPSDVHDRQVELDGLAQISAAFLRHFRAHWLGDSFDWKPSTESPPCEACGWVFEASPEAVEEAKGVYE